MDNPKLYSTSEAAQFLGISKATLNRLVNRRIIEPAQTGSNGYRYFTESQLAHIPKIVKSGSLEPAQVAQSGSQTESQSGATDSQVAHKVAQPAQSDAEVNHEPAQLAQTDSQSGAQVNQPAHEPAHEPLQTGATESPTESSGAKKQKTAQHSEAAITRKSNTTTSKKKSKDPISDIPALHFKHKKKKFSYSDWIRSRKDLADQARQYLPNLLYELGIANLNRNFSCSIFNPNHADHTPSVTYYADTQCVHCHGCGFHGDIFKVYATAYNKPIDKALFDEVFTKYGLLNYTGSDSKVPKRPNITPVAPPTDAKKELIDRTADINVAIANLQLTDYWKRRGFTLETAQYFRMGYIPQWKHPDFNTPPSDRLILPTGDGVYSYLARDVHSNGDYKVLKVGGKVLFNLEGLNGEYIIVNEGEFDAISTWQVGFHNVVGLGGVGNKDKFVEAVTTLTVKPKFIIIALDNDEAGINAAQWIHSELDKLQIYSIIINDYFGNNKDANALLPHDSDTLKAIYNKAIEQAEREYKSYIFPEIEIPDDDFDIADPFELSEDILEKLMYFNQTEAGNAERFVEAYGQKLIYYLTDSGRWLNFDGCQWFKAADTTNSSITNLVVAMARQLRIFANSKANQYKVQQVLDKQKSAEYLVANMRKLEQRKGVDNTIYFAKGLDKIRITNEDLNTHRTLLNCRNGVVDLITGKLMPHDSNLLMTQCTNAYYIPNYHNELLETTLRQIIPDEETFDQFFKFLAYGLTGLTDEEKAAFIRGRGGNGKGTVTKLITKTLGNYAVTLPADILLMASYLRDGNAPTPELAKLEFIRLAICDEMPPGRRMDIAKFKLLIGSDVLSVRELHRDPRMIDPMFKLILSGNHLPEIDDANDVALKRRLIVYPFTQDFTQTGDPKLKSGLMKQDPINALMTLLVNYCIRYFKEGLGVSAAMQQARDEYLNENDSIGQFITENCEFDANSSILRNDFLERIKRSGNVSGMTNKSIIDAAKKIPGINYYKSGLNKLFGIKWRDNNPRLDIVPPPSDSDYPNNKSK